MKRQNIISGIAIGAVGLVTIAVVVREPPNTDPMSTREHEDSAEAPDFPRGPHGGRLLEDGSFALEVVIYESGIPPEFHLYGYAGGSALAPGDFDAEITLFRLGEEPTGFAFEPEMDYLRGIGVVREPHSFDVEVRVRHDGQRFEWSYESHEGRTRIPDRVAEAQGIAVESAGPATIRDVVELTGTVQIDPGRVSEIRARFPGIVTDVRRTVGDTVARGETLAMVETNESLRSVAITAPIAGLIVDRNIQPGQPTGDVPLFVVADLSEVWINLDVFGRDLEAIAPGQPVHIETLGGVRIDEKIDWVSPLVAHGSQSVRARVTAANPDARLRPGQFVRASVVTGEHDVPLAVRQSGLQRFREFDVVFARVRDVYEVRMLELGRSDADYVEVSSGLRPGEIYVTRNSYLIKADIEKAGASHDH